MKQAQILSECPHTDAIDVAQRLAAEINRLLAPDFQVTHYRMTIRGSSTYLSITDEAEKVTRDGVVGWQRVICAEWRGSLYGRQVYGRVSSTGSLFQPAKIARMAERFRQDLAEAKRKEDALARSEAIQTNLIAKLQDLGFSRSDEFLKIFGDAHDIQASVGRTTVSLKRKVGDTSLTVEPARLEDLEEIVRKMRAW